MTHDENGRRGRFVMETYSGRLVDPTQIVPDDVCVEDVAFHLASICRFSGAARVYVASHSVTTARLVGLMGGCPRCQYDGLMHDGHETYLNDVISPVGRQEFMRPFHVLKVFVQRAIDTALPGPPHAPGCAADTKIVHTADVVSALLESDANLPSRGRDWHCGTARLYELVERFRPVFPELRGPRGPTHVEAEMEFLRVWELLRKGESL